MAVRAAAGACSGKTERTAKLRRVTPVLRTQIRSRVGVLLQELGAHALLIGMVLSSDLGFSGLLLLLAADLIMAAMLSMLRLWPQRRGFWSFAGGFLLLSVLLAALVGVMLMFCLFAHAVVASGMQVGFDRQSILQLFDFDVSALRWAVFYSALHLSLMLLFSRFQSKPAETWRRVALLSGAVSFYTLFLLIFVIAFLGRPAIDMVNALGIASTPQTILIALAIAVRLGFTAIMTFVPEVFWDRTVKTASDLNPSKDNH